MKWVNPAARAGLVTVACAVFGGSDARAHYANLEPPKTLGRGPEGIYATRDPFLFTHNVGLVTGLPSAVEAESVIPRWDSVDGCQTVKVVPNPYRGRADWDLIPSEQDPTGGADRVSKPPLGPVHDRHLHLVRGLGTGGGARRAGRGRNVFLEHDHSKRAKCSERHLSLHGGNRWGRYLSGQVRHHPMRRTLVG